MTAPLRLAPALSANPAIARIELASCSLSERVQVDRADLCAVLARLDWHERRHEAALSASAPAQAHSATSVAAAKALTAETLRGRRLSVFHAIAARGSDGATDDEIDEAFGAFATQRPRRVELRDAGLVRDSGERRVGPCGRTQTVWIAT